MKISISSCYSFAICELEVDSKELVKEVQKLIDEGFGQIGGVSLRRGVWERVVVTEKDIINCLCGNDDCDINIYYCYTSNNEQCWEKITLFPIISDYIRKYCGEEEELVELGEATNRQVFIQGDLVHEDF